MTQLVGNFVIHLEHVQGYVFRTRFDKAQHPDLLVDEPAPLGADSAPNPARILAAAVANCLAASLQFCLAKSGIQATALSAKAQVQLVRNAQNRLRIGRVDVTLNPQVDAPEELDACLGLFEDFCVVTESVRQGLDVRVHVEAHKSSNAA